MDVQILVFPETRVAAITHQGSPLLEHDTARKLIAWKLAHKLLDPLKYRSYGIHYTNPHTVAPSDHRVDICLSIDFTVEPNAAGIVNKIIPRNKCARARDIGSRYNNQAAAYLAGTWLPQSGEAPGDFPIFFHYVNVGPAIREADMITDVYLPLQPPP